jgi:predicted  nucleic acid-binding Zn-ribbon protein
VQTSRINFPILHSFRITGYQLYPGRPGSPGIDAELLPGVSVVVGINGLGKTTLLNALFRVLSGPVDWSSRPIDQLAGTTSNDLGKWKTETFFRRRVADGAKNANITAKILFGTEEIEVTRRLYDLGLRSLKVSGKQVSNDETEYQAAVCRLSGLREFEDFFLLLRYLVFFLEDRQQVVWDKSAQADILRVLFFDEEESARARKLYNQVQATDSDLRNFTYAHNKLENRLKAVRKALAEEQGTAAKIGAVETRLNAARDGIEELEERLALLDADYAQQRLTLERERIDVVELQREYERQEQQYFAQVFPSLTEIANYVLVHVSSGGGCLVCGNHAPEARGRVRELAAAGICPVCESTPDLQEGVVPPQQLSNLRLEELDAQIAEMQQHIGALTEEVDSLSEQRATARKTLVGFRREFQDAQQEYEKLVGHLPPAAEDIMWLEAAVNSGRKEVKRLEEKNREVSADYAKLLDHGETRVRAIAERVIAKFEEYAKYFLADKCTLEYAIDKRRIGQRGRIFDFPSFTVRLSSGVFDHTVQPRMAAYEVSESQKEFIDLAFRMALIAVGANDRPAMMVLETPEASLDAIFIGRAGRLLSMFASMHGNRLLASSNLNQTDMISALFGVVTPKLRKVLDPMPELLIPSAERDRRVIDLLELAEPNAALKEYKEGYVAEFRRAVHPEEATDESPPGEPDESRPGEG